MEVRPEWNNIGVYRTFPLPILPIPAPITKKKVYKQSVCVSPKKQYTSMKSVRK